MPAYARTALFQLVARIQFVLRPAMLAQFDKSQCFSLSRQARPGSQRIVVLYVVMRGRFVPRSSHARLFAGLLVADRGSSTRADG